MFHKLTTFYCLVLSSMLAATATASSLYSDDQYFSLHEDKQQISVGDVVTVLIYEQASASTSAGTDTDRETDISATLSSTSRRERGALDLNNDFRGGGSISREGELIASVSVTVKAILASGNIFIQGQQMIEFNNETQHINIQGTVRPEDVSPENTVLSSHIADAQITYKGDGLLGKQQKPGLFSKMFRWLF